MQKKNFNINLIFAVALTLTLNIIFTGNDAASSQIKENISPSKKCKCPLGKKWNGKKCVKKTGEEVCFTLFDPVCGCDGMTYSNSCDANLNGIKKFTRGECNNPDTNKSFPIQIDFQN